MVNAAVKSHLSRALGPALEAAIGPRMAELREQYQQAQGNAVNGTEGDSTERQLAELNAGLKAEKEARAKERAAAHNERAYNALVSELTGKVRPEVVSDVADLLFHGRRMVKVGSDGTATMRLDDEVHDIKAGVAAYLKTDAAKFYLPAPSAPKSPARGASTQPRAPVPPAVPGRRADPMQKTLEDLERLGLTKNDRWATE